MLKKSLVAFSIFIGTTSAATAATCISEANFKAQAPFYSPYVHNVTRDDGSLVSLYLKSMETEQDGFKEVFLEVVRKDKCILAMNVIDRQVVDDRYQVYAGWSELEEGASGDNEGMPEGEGEGEEVALTDDENFPFLNLAGYAIPKFYKGPIGKPDFKGRDKNFADFRTRIKNAMSEGVNFSGQYALTQIGCGTSCSFAILSDLKTGKQYDFIRGGEDVGPLSLKFSPDSSLLIATWTSEGKCNLESLMFNGEWVTLAKPTVGPEGLCYETVDDNIARYKASMKAQTITAVATAAGPIEKPSGEQNKLAEHYESYIYLRACNGRSDALLSKGQLRRARIAITTIESHFVEKGGVDKDAAWKTAQKKAEDDPLLAGKQGDSTEISQVCSEAYEALITASGGQSEYLEKDF